MTTLETVIIVAGVVLYALYRQFTTQPVTLRSLALPAIGALYLASRYTGPFDPLTLAVLGGAAVFGLTAGALSGAVVKIWYDPASGMVLRRGGWQFVLTLVVLVGIRFALRLALQHSGLPVTAAVVTDSFIGMSVGVYLGRIGVVALRALALTGGNVGPLTVGGRASRLAGGAR